jgi:hypothetical protein
MSAGLERVFSGARHTIAPKRIRLGAGIVEITEYLKSWIQISEGRQQAPLSGAFQENQALTEAIKCLEAVSAEAVEELDHLLSSP